MALAEKLMTDLTQAMKEKNEVKTSVLRMLKAAIQNKTIEKKVKLLPDEDIIEAIHKQVKQRKESIEEFKKGNRPDLVEKESKEIVILEQYLPPQMSEAEITSLVKELIQSVGAKSKADRGRLMKEVMPRVKGRADGRIVNQVVSSLLL